MNEYSRITEIHAELVTETAVRLAAAYVSNRGFESAECFEIISDIARELVFRSVVQGERLKKQLEEKKRNDKDN